MTTVSFVTFTGVDRFTDLDRLECLSAQYPIEWGILFGDASNGTRYPDGKTIRNAVARRASFAAHLCGQHALEFQQGGDHSKLGMFHRIQVNMRSENYDFDLLSRRSAELGRRLIIQVRGDKFPVDCNFDYLHDASGGRGVSPEAWPAAPDNHIITGFAGGITPENVVNSLATIKAGLCWIDMETGVRTDDRLDLDKCEEICRAVEVFNRRYSEGG